MAVISILGDSPEITTTIQCGKFGNWVMYRAQRKNKERGEESTTGGQVVRETQEMMSELSLVAGGLVGLEKVRHPQQTVWCVKRQGCRRAKVFKELKHFSTTSKW